MAPNPRVINAYNAMRTLGVSADEVKPVLIKLLNVYDRRWELIEEDNYRTLVDAYFESKEDKVFVNIFDLAVHLYIDLINRPCNFKCFMCLDKLFCDCFIRIYINHLLYLLFWFLLS